MDEPKPPPIFDQNSALPDWIAESQPLIDAAPESVYRAVGGQLLRSNWLTVKSYAGRLKVTYFKYLVREKGWQACGTRSPPLDGLGTARLENSVSRSRARVYELALCNEWRYFVTLTLSPDNYDRNDLGRFRADLTQWLRNQRRKHGLEIKYLLIPELHKKGGWHMHGLFSDLPPDDLRAFSVYNNIPKRLKKLVGEGREVFDWLSYAQKFGYVTAERVRNADAVAAYITKYITKNMAADMCKFNKHLFFASNGLQGAVTLWEGQSEPPASFDFENEAVRIAWNPAPETLAALTFGELEQNACSETLSIGGENFEL